MSTHATESSSGEAHKRSDSSASTKKSQSSYESLASPRVFGRHRAGTNGRR